MNDWENVLVSTAIFVAGWAGDRQQTDIRRRDEFQLAYVLCREIKKGKDGVREQLAGSG